jgi:RNA polymerase sigma-70 factor, ECF subfamily
VSGSKTVDQFTRVYDANYRHVYAYAVVHAGRQLADEVVADTFLVAWRRFAEMPRATPLPWLLAVARNVVRERYRAEQRQRAVAAELREWITDAEADIADGVAERAVVLAALARLSDADRELLTLVAWHGLAPKRAAQVVGCSTATYFMRLHRARKRLQDAMTTTESETGRHARTVLIPKESTR